MSGGCLFVLGDGRKTNQLAPFVHSLLPARTSNSNPATLLLSTSIHPSCPVLSRRQTPHRLYSILPELPSFLHLPSDVCPPAGDTTTALLLLLLLLLLLTSFRLLFFFFFRICAGDWMLNVVFLYSIFLCLFRKNKKKTNICQSKKENKTNLFIISNSVLRLLDDFSFRSNVNNFERIHDREFEEYEANYHHH